MDKILHRIARQRPKKLIIMVYNFFRMLMLMIAHRYKFEVSLIQNIHPSAVFIFEGGKIELKHSVFTRKNVSFCAAGGEMIIGTSFFNQGCSIMARKKVVIGDDCLFGPNVVIVDHDHDYRCPDVQRGTRYICKDVLIGNNVVVGANAIILKGTVIEDNCMIGAGSVVSGTIPKGTLYYSEHIGHMKRIEFKEVEG